MEEKARGMMREYASQFPDIEVLSSTGIKSLLHDESDASIQLIDVRTKSEINVSKIPGAVTKEDFETMLQKGEIDKHKTICVPYCTMGYRSGQYAKELKNRGIMNVRNGEGIVLWTHAGGELVSVDESGDEIPTKSVHTFGAQWNLIRSDYNAVYDTWWSNLCKALLNIGKT